MKAEDQEPSSNVENAPVSAQPVENGSKPPVAESSPQPEPYPYRWIYAM